MNLPRPLGDMAMLTNAKIITEEMKLKFDKSSASFRNDSAIAS
jgi:hypothetical protein